MVNFCSGRGTLTLEVDARPVDRIMAGRYAQSLARQEPPRATRVLALPQGATRVSKHLARRAAHTLCRGVNIQGSESPPGGQGAAETAGRAGWGGSEGGSEGGREGVNSQK
eukprot:SAG31_NODE_279_length_18600_cov_21.254527_7_plen_111_part_00